eukprot:s1025_g17.t1
MPTFKDSAGIGPAGLADCLTAVDSSWVLKKTRVGTNLSGAFGEALEHQSRVNTATFEENQRRQVTRQRRCEQGLEELSSRLTFTRLLQTEAHVELEGNPLGEADDDGDDGAEMWKGYPEIVAASAHVVEAVCILHVLLISDS